MYRLYHPEVGPGRMAGVGRRINIAMLVGWFALRVPGVAFAEHDHAMMMSEHHQEDSSELSIGVSAQAAAFDNMYYGGSYQGLTPSLGWMYGRFGASTTVGLYHL